MAKVADAIYWVKGYVMKFSTKVFGFVAAFTVFIVWWLLSLSELPREEAKWCRQYRPDMSTLECAKEFGY